MSYKSLRCSANRHFRAAFGARKTLRVRAKFLMNTEFATSITEIQPQKITRKAQTTLVLAEMILNESYFIRTACVADVSGYGWAGHF